MKKPFLCVFLLLAFSPIIHSSETLTIAVASNFSEPLKKIIPIFSTTSPRVNGDIKEKIRVVAGSSGKLYAQIRQGAPFDIFLSADTEKPQALEKLGLLVSGSRFTYAKGRLALWQVNDELNKKKAIRLFEQTPLVERPLKIALANPRFAPYGVAAQHVIHEKMAFRDGYDRLIIAENVSQAYQFIATKNVDMGFIAYSQTLMGKHRPLGRVQLVPASYHPPIRQDGGILRRAEKNPLAKQFVKFIHSSRYRELLPSLGYTP